MKPRHLLHAAVPACIAMSSPAMAQDIPAAYGPPDIAAQPAVEDEADEFRAPSPVEPAESAGDGPFFPIWGDKARERGIDIPPAFGMAGMTVNNKQTLAADNLAANIVKGDTIPGDISLIDLPFVTAHDLKSDTFNSQFKADLWIFPFLDVFAAVGKSKGHIDVVVDIDLDAFVPFPFCRPAKPCGTTTLPFEAKVDNTTFTVGSVLAYGSEKWFVSASAAKTIAVAAKKRSDIQTTDLSMRGGPRFPLGGDVIFSPYVGAGFFDMDVNVTGEITSGPLFEDGDPIAMRYNIDLSPTKPWAGIAGGLLQIGRHWMVQGEYNLGAASNRFMVSLTWRP